MKALYFDGDNGEDIRIEEIPANLAAEAARKREEMLDAVSMFSDELMEAMLEGTPTEELIREAVRRGTLALKLTPVIVGSAYKNKGVQPLLDAVGDYLPSPIAGRERRPRPRRRRGRGQAQPRTPPTRWSRWPSSSRTAATVS